MSGCIYKIKNISNSKIYIGKTCQDPYRRWYFHKYTARKGGGMLRWHFENCKMKGC